MPERVASPVLVGRGDELERLEDAAAGVRTTGFHAVLVGGDAGMGKTRLVTEFARRPRDPALRVLWGGCLGPDEPGLPFAPFRQALRELLRSMSDGDQGRILGPGRADLARLLPELGAGVPSVERQPVDVARARLFERLLGVLDRLTIDEPAALVLEDLHWADRASLELLRFIVHNARAIPLLLVGTYRSDELAPAHPLRALLAAPARLERTTSFVLRPLEREEIAAQVAAIRGDAPPQLVDALTARSEGNPFVVEELLTSAGPGGGLGPLPPTLRDVLLGRLRRLSPRTRELIGAAAVAGPWIDEDLLADTTGWSPDDVERALREALDHSVIVVATRGDREGYAFRHALLAEAADEDLLPRRRRQLHGMIAGALTRSPDRERRPAEWAAARAHHLYAAGELEAALPAAVEAGLAAEAALAHAEALRQFERALELWPRVRAARSAPLDHAALLEHMAEAAMSGGAWRRAVELLRDAIAELCPSGDGERIAELHRILALDLRDAGDTPAALDAIEAALRGVPQEPSSSRAAILALRGAWLAYAERCDEAEPLLDEAAAIARTLPPGDATDRIRWRAADGLGWCRYWASDLPAAVATFRPARLGAMEAGSAEAIADLTMHEGCALFFLDRFEETIAIAQSARDRLRTLGLEVRYGLHPMYWSGLALLSTGRWIAAERSLGDDLAADPPPRVRANLLEVRCILHARQGRHRDARADLAECLALEAAGAVDLTPVQHEEAEIAVALLEGRWSDVTALVGTLALPHRAMPVSLREDLRARIQASSEEAIEGRRRRDTDRVARALQVAREDAALMRRIVAFAGGFPGGVPASFVADAAFAEAELSRAEGCSAPDLWAEAVRLREPTGMPFELAWSRYRLAEALLESGRRRAEASAHLATAHAIAAGLGAGGLRDQAADLARRARIDLTSSPDAATGRRRRTQGDPYGLSDREREVLELLVAGRTNREIGDALFISEKTASVHVTHILDKLGVTSRGAAAALAARSGIC